MGLGAISGGCIPAARTLESLHPVTRAMAVRAEIKPFASAEGHARFRAVRDWAAGRELPRLVELVDGDNELLVDFDNPLSVDAFADVIKDRSSIQLTEALAIPDHLCVSGPEGMFTHEIHVPVIRDSGVQRVAEIPASVWEQAGSCAPSVRRSIAPGAEWTFLKIYAGASEIDRIVVSVVGPLVSELIQAGVIDRWFFIRLEIPMGTLG